jgi:hypothetical protein
VPAPRSCIARTSQPKKRQNLIPMKRSLTLLSLGLLGMLAAGCVSQPLKIPTVTKRDYDVLGEGKGSATGLMLFDVIPIGQNQRFVKAYDAAIKSKDGDALIDPVITESWFWGYILDGYSTHITGTVIKYK